MKKILKISFWKSMAIKKLFNNFEKIKQNSKNNS